MPQSPDLRNLHGRPGHPIRRSGFLPSVNEPAKRPYSSIRPRGFPTGPARNAEIERVGLIGDYPPRRCGIATFTGDLQQALADEYPATDCLVIPVNDVADGYDYSSEVCFEFLQQDLSSYRRAAEFLNSKNVDVVCLQHEYGIFGGPAGQHILSLLRDLHMPVVTTLHTVLRDPPPEYRRVMLELTELSSRLVVMSKRGRDFLTDIYRVPARKIDLIAHGIPDMPRSDPHLVKEKLGVAGRPVVLTFGLLSPNKGIEYALAALPDVIRKFPNLVYLVVGATHPHLVRQQGERYRIGLERLAHDLGIGENVIFYNQFVEREELLEFIRAADIYLTPYLEPAQITSGTLSYAFGCGKPVISTPYWHAEELLADGRGVLVPFRDSSAIAERLGGLLGNHEAREDMGNAAYALGREMTWNRTIHRYMDSFTQAVQGDVGRSARSLNIQALDEHSWKLPEFRLDHLLRMSDSTGLLQHASFSLPNYDHGYCTDDNARALLFAVLLEDLKLDTPESRAAGVRYAAFLNAAFDPAVGRFRNFLGFDRQWLPEDNLGSDDCLGRAVHVLGACIGRSQQRSLQAWAMEPFRVALAKCPETTSPRGWAEAIMGIHESRRKLGGDSLADQIQETLIRRLLELYQHTATEEWPWFEESLSYNNPSLPHALILNAEPGRSSETRETGLRALEWIFNIQRAPEGHFRPIGCDRIFRKGGTPPRFDQQPIEALSMVAACADAYRATEDATWLNRARTAFEWFLGRNDLGLELYDANTGGCHDGLHENRVNENQGAESTLAFLLSLAELKLIQGSTAAARDDSASAASGIGPLHGKRPPWNNEPVLGS